MKVWLAALILLLQASTGRAGALPPTSGIDAAVHNVMTRTGALIRNGRICHVQASGVRNAKGDLI